MTFVALGIGEIQSGVTCETHRACHTKTNWEAGSRARPLLLYGWPWPSIELTPCTQSRPTVLCGIAPHSGVKCQDWGLNSLSVDARFALLSWGPGLCIVLDSQKSGIVNSTTENTTVFSIIDFVPACQWSQGHLLNIFFPFSFLWVWYPVTEQWIRVWRVNEWMSEWNNAKQVIWLQTDTSAFVSAQPGNK